VSNTGSFKFYKAASTVNCIDASSDAANHYFLSIITWYSKKGNGMRLKTTFNNIVKSTIMDDCFTMASGMAFNLILAIFPFLLVITAIFSIFSTEDTVIDILLLVNSVVPPQILSIIERTLMEILNMSSGRALTIGSVLGVAFASNAINVLMKFLNKAYGVPETRPAWKVRAISIWVIMLFVFAIFVITNMIIMGKVILHFVDAHVPAISDSAIDTISIARWPITFLLLFIIGFIIYYFVPNISTSFKNRTISALPGTLFFTLIWMGMSRLFGLYIEHISQLNRIYGTLGTIVILLLWLYYTALVVLVGGEVNSEFYRQIKSKE
jgi:membrane protein